MLGDVLKNPFYAALFGAIATMIYIYGVTILNREPPPRNADMIKPAILNALLTGMVVFLGTSQPEEIYQTPFPDYNRGI